MQLCRNTGDHYTWYYSWNHAWDHKEVYALLERVWKAALAKAKAERAELQAQMAKDLPGQKLEPWDWRYYQEQVRKAMAEAIESVKPVAADIQFSVDEHSGRTVVKVVDTATGHILRQIPWDETPAMSRALARLKGIIVDSKA